MFGRTLNLSSVHTAVQSILSLHVLGIFEKLKRSLNINGEEEEMTALKFHHPSPAHNDVWYVTQLPYTLEQSKQLSLLQLQLFKQIKLAVVIWET